MSAGTLRAAAALIRERARLATSGPWTADGVAIWGTETYTVPVGGGSHRFNTEHIVSWQPDVTLDAAELFETAADAGPAHGGLLWDATVTLARTYLGAPQRLTKGGDDQ